MCEFNWTYLRESLTEKNIIKCWNRKTFKNTPVDLFYLKESFQNSVCRNLLTKPIEILSGEFKIEIVIFLSVFEKVWINIYKQESNIWISLSFWVISYDFSGYHKFWNHDLIRKTVNYEKFTQDLEWTKQQNFRVTFTNFLADKFYFSESLTPSTNLRRFIFFVIFSFFPIFNLTA